MNQPAFDERERREAEHFDAEAVLAETAAVDDEASAVTSPTDVRIEQILGDVTGLRILDVGCGNGAWTQKFAEAGADVDGIDISARMIAIARKRLDRNDVRGNVRLRQMSATRLDYPDGTFDAVCGRYIVHHLEPAVFGAEVARVLKPGGIAVFCENNGTNGLLMLARRTLCGRFGISKWSTPDEYPLTPARRRAFARNFTHLRAEYPEFVMFDLFDAKLFRRRIGLVTRACAMLDRFCGSVAWLRRFSYVQLFTATR